MKVEGSVAVVTGAAGGIGLAVAQRLLEHGAHVVVTDLDAARTSAAVASLEPHGADRVAGLAGDCSLEADVQAVLDLAVERFGPVDLYVANAGVGLGQGLESSEEDWSTSLDVNVMAHVRAARLLVPGWLERGRGYFLSTASAAGLLTQIGSPTYSVTKHAAVAFAEWLSVTYGTRGIAVSCLCPMGVNTAMLNGGADSDDPTARQGARAVTEAGGVLEPLDVADVVLDAIDDERFLVLPHPEVLEFYRRKASDYDRWLAGMRRYQDTLA
ncbi:SDR family oxidoreductase [Aeromicrobium sp. REDSEA-S38_B2]|jgi:NAD(P)-dependent dehydrogenase (short-subunit alcohol dehydrogenase family)|uniref:SDR family oxidoreductase n=1 Tax=Aeromicrobium sp. REDSEA-S38_B2 TaxID=1811528 RepID=UPI000AB574B3|nr:SDR family oxidoreductase [Aeromicrobium sp. REDSEA-S38_B2]